MLQNSNSFKGKYQSILFFFILLFVFISIIFIPNRLIDLRSESNHFENRNNDLPIIKTSVNNPPNKNYFTYYKMITINHEKVNGTGSHKNFPVLISILDSDLHNHVNQSNGNDIAFANDTDWLYHEIELFNQNYNGTHARLVAWVLIPNLSTSVNTIIYIYYGNATITSRENPTNVWSSYTSVWHLKESTGEGYYIKDSTSNNYDGIPSGTEYLSSGKVGAARNFSSDSDGIIVSNGTDLLNGYNRFIFSFWIYPNYASDLEWQNAGTDLVFYKASSINLARMWRNSGYPAGHGVFQADIHFVTHATLYYNFYIVCQSWNNIIYYYDGISFGIYLNGDEIYQTYIGSDSLISDSSTFLLGTTGSDCFNGYIDEFRISSNVNTKGWYETEFNNQNDSDSFFTFGSEGIVDTTPPSYSNLIENFDPLELGQTEIIRINVSDFSDILQVKIQFEGSNYSMTKVGGDTWRYNEWTPNTVGNYTYVIYMEDKMENWNSTIGRIKVIDTTPPTYSNLIESSDPLELGQNEVIQVNVNDLAGILEVKIEFEGLNHSMTNIGGNTWQYNSWVPTNWITYQYKIYMQDNNDNWNSTVGSIAVSDTISPTPPILNNPPSGDITGNIVFDWLDGSDPSGISYYILIIDNETNPLDTPGYVYFFNITNLGSESSYYEVTDPLPSGKYYYFLAQIDGAGHQSSYTMGSFTINVSQNDDFMIYLILIIALISVLGSVTGIIIIRKRTQRKLRVSRKKIPLKLVLPHVKEISSSSGDREIQVDIIQKQNTQETYREELLDEMKEGPNIEEIKNLGEQLFDDGAYLEAIEQFELAKIVSRKIGREEDVKLFSELVEVIKALIKEREITIQALDKEKIDGNSRKIFELYQNLIDISKKLRDIDAVDMFKSDMIDFFNDNKYKLIEMQKYRGSLEEHIESLLSIGQYKEATQELEKCVQISELLMNFNKNEIINIEKFKNKKLNLLQRLNNN